MPGGRLLVEIGPTQGAAVAALFNAAGLGEVRVLPDMDGRDRVVAAAKPGATDRCGCALLPPIHAESRKNFLSHPKACD